MTSHTAGGALPFLLHFGERMPKRLATPLRYDARRRVSQVFTCGEWVDALDMRQAEMGVTKLTGVARETTDDE
jgi:hypothetical protein